MQALEIAGLLAAGVLAGGMNAVAGGGSFVAFPVLVGVGLSSQTANASTTVALLPGGLASAWAFRRGLVPVGPASLSEMAVASLLGGAAGAALLLATPSSTFDRVVPFLLLLATVMLALGDRPRRALERRSLQLGRRGALAVQALLAVYGGYFGGAVGLMMLAAWSLLSRADLRAQMPARTIMVSMANAAAALCFAAAAAVAWGPTLAMLTGGIAGGYAGARLAGRLPRQVIRAIVLAVCALTTATFFARAFL